MFTKMDEPAMVQYMIEIKNMNVETYTNERKRIFQLINGDIFFPINSWPNNIKKKFFNKPHSDKDTMILFLFFHGMKSSKYKVMLSSKLLD